MKTALFPGSFDPFTIGHQDILMRALPLFDHIHIAVGNNSQKKYCYSPELRIGVIRKAYAGEDKISVGAYDALTITYCREVGAGFILRGLRNTTDFEYEKSIAQLNFQMGNIETVFLMSSPEYAHISSTIVREIKRYDGDISRFLPEGMQYRS